MSWKYEVTILSTSGNRGRRKVEGWHRTELSASRSEHRIAVGAWEDVTWP